MWNMLTVKTCLNFPHNGDISFLSLSRVSFLEQHRCFCTASVYQRRFNRVSIPEIRTECDLSCESNWAGMRELCRLHNRPRESAEVGRTHRISSAKSISIYHGWEIRRRRKSRSSHFAEYYSFLINKELACARALVIRVFLDRMKWIRSC